MLRKKAHCLLVQKKSAYDEPNKIEARKAYESPSLLKDLRADAVKKICDALLRKDSVINDEYEMCICRMMTSMELLICD